MKRTIGIGLAAGILGSVCFGTAAMAELPEDLWEYTTATDENGNIIFDFKEIEVTVPADWAGRCGMSVSDDRVTFYHMASREAQKAQGWTPGGRLLTVACSEDQSFTQTEPSYSIVGDGAYGTYYIALPTDVQGYTQEETIYNDWKDVSDDVEWIKSRVTIWNGNSDSSSSGSIQIVPEHDDEYYFADSSSRYLEAWELSGMTDDELQMAINEIYARHHRKFVLKNVQEYFNSKSWYTGTVEASNFDPSVMNQYEWANIELMLKVMNQ